MNICLFSGITEKCFFPTSLRLRGPLQNTDVKRNCKVYIFVEIWFKKNHSEFILIFSDPSGSWNFEAKINNWLVTDYFEFLIQKMTSKITQNFIILILRLLFLLLKINLLIFIVLYLLREEALQLIFIKNFQNRFCIFTT